MQGLVKNQRLKIRVRKNIGSKIPLMVIGRLSTSILSEFLLFVLFYTETKLFPKRNWNGEIVFSSMSCRVVFFLFLTKAKLSSGAEVIFLTSN